MAIDRDARQRLRDACSDGDKVFTVEIVLRLLDALDEIERKAWLEGYDGRASGEESGPRYE